MFVHLTCLLPKKFFLTKNRGNRYVFRVNKKRKSEENDAPGFNYHSQLRAEGNANRPLLQVFVFTLLTSFS